MKKNKKVVIGIFAVIVLIMLSVTVFATDTTKNVINNSNNKKSNNTSNEISNNTSKNTNETTNSSKELKEDELIPALEEKLKQKQQTTSKKEAETEKETKKETEKNDDIVATKPTLPFYTKELEEDITILNCDEKINYEKTFIDGNVFIISSEDVKFVDCQVNGDVFIISNNIKFSNFVVNGSMYIGGTEKIDLSEVKVDSVYAFGNKLDIDSLTSIEKELRFVGKTLNVNCEIGRNLNAITESVTISDFTEIGNDCNITGEKADISEDAKIVGDKNLNITEVLGIENDEIKENVVKSTLLELATEFVIILILAIFILGGFPKFTEINSRLKLRHFFTSFFSGILELVIVLAVSLGLLIWGYGVGYGIGIVSLFITLLGFGKVFFIIAFAIRMCEGKNKALRVRSFFMTIFVALVVQVINLISLLGYTGSIITLIFNIIIGISGFGSLITVILSARPKANKDIKVSNSESAIPEVKTAEPVVTKVADNSNVQPVEPKDIEIKNVAINNLEIKNVDEKKSEEVTDIKTDEEVKDSNNDNNNNNNDENNNNDSNNNEN